MQKFSFILILLMSSQLSYAESYIGTRWSDTDRDYKSCILEGKKTLKMMKFAKNLDHHSISDDEGSGSTWGSTANYKAVIRCVPNHSIVFFVVSGKKPRTVKKYVNNIKKSFTAYE